MEALRLIQIVNSCFFLNNLSTSADTAMLGLRLPSVLAGAALYSNAELSRLETMLGVYTTVLEGRASASSRFRGRVAAAGIAGGMVVSGIDAALTNYMINQADRRAIRDYAEFLSPEALRWILEEGLFRMSLEQMSSGSGLIMVPGAEPFVRLPNDLFFNYDQWFNLALNVADAIDERLFRILCQRKHLDVQYVI